ncbi:hypothetical protein [Rhizobium changzhiense]|nr:hypothetical protein [Rhizobium changzhiense]
MTAGVGLADEKLTTGLDYSPPAQRDGQLLSDKLFSSSHIS